MKTLHATDPRTYARMTTRELRENFLIDSLFPIDTIPLIYWETDRTIIGSAVPVSRSLKLEATEKELAADYFLQRRELGVLNIGGAGLVEVDGQEYPLAKQESLYVGRGARDVVFQSCSTEDAAKFFLISYPAHCFHPTTLIGASQTNRLELGSQHTSNCRIISQQIHEKGAASCQLVMGYTELAPGNVWNTMPPHTHQRRSEVYLYFDVPDDQAVFHFMGPGQETRHLAVANGQAVLSPIWSIHSGVGTCAYKFAWAMGGENQRFDDMDGISISNLR